MIQGSDPERTAPRPIRRLCIENPSWRWDEGSRSPTKARKGSMLMFTEASSTQRRPAAIHTEEELGMAIRAQLAMIAPARK